MPKSLEPTHIGAVEDVFGGDPTLVYTTPESGHGNGYRFPLVRVESADSVHVFSADGARELAAQLLRAADQLDPQEPPTPKEILQRAEIEAGLR